MRQAEEGEEQSVCRVDAAPSSVLEATETAHEDLHRKAASGAVMSISAQVISFILRMNSVLILARLVAPTDFGLVAMVLAFTGFLGVFRDMGLSMAAVQKVDINDAQASALFWINLGAGLLLAGLCSAAAPFLSDFYREPRLTGISFALAAGFIFNGAAAQHRAMLQRNLRFVALAVVDIASLIGCVGVSIGAAVMGFGYWAIVLLNVAFPFFNFLGVFLAHRWIPGIPVSFSGVGPLLLFGGRVTISNVISYASSNLDKVLLGRIWGAQALGIYGRAFQLFNMPIESVNCTLGLVMFPALSRLQKEPAAFRRFFLIAYEVFLSVMVPLGVCCAFFGSDMIDAFLGPKWTDARRVFELLSPTIISFGVMYPLAWTMLATGRAVRNLRISLLVAPFTIAGYCLGLRYGPTGVAAGFSAGVFLSIWPVVWWATRGTAITVADILLAAGRPLFSALVGIAVVFSVSGWLSHVQPAILRLGIELAFFAAVYCPVFLLGLDQKKLYATVIRQGGFGRPQWGRGGARDVCC